MGDDGRPRFFGIFAIDPLVGVALVQPDAGWAVVATVQSEHGGQPLLHLAGERIVRGAHIGEHRPALRGRHFLRVQHREPRWFVLVRRVGVPVGGALHAEPVDLSVLVDIGQPRHFRILGVAIVDE